MFEYVKDNKGDKLVSKITNERNKLGQYSILLGYLKGQFEECCKKLKEHEGKLKVLEEELKTHLESKKDNKGKIIKLDGSNGLS